MRELFLELNIDAAYSSDYITDKESIARLYDGSGMHNVQIWFKTSDLAKIGMIMAGNGSLNGIQVLKPETVKLMETDTVDSYEEGTYRYTEGLSCHNFKTLLEGREIHGHTGSALGAITALYFDPIDQTGIVILDNHASNIKDENNRTHVLYDTLKECYEDYFNESMLDIYE